MAIVANRFIISNRRVLIYFLTAVLFSVLASKMISRFTSPDLLATDNLEYYNNAVHLKAGESGISVNGMLSSFFHLPYLQRESFSAFKRARGLAAAISMAIIFLACWRAGIPLLYTLIIAGWWLLIPSTILSWLGVCGAISFLILAEAKRSNYFFASLLWVLLSLARTEYVLPGITLSIFTYFSGTKTYQKVVLAVIWGAFFFLAYSFPNTHGSLAAWIQHTCFSAVQMHMISGNMYNQDDLNRCVSELLGSPDTTLGLLFARPGLMSLHFLRNFLILPGNIFFYQFAPSFGVGAVETGFLIPFLGAVSYVLAVVYFLRNRGRENYKILVFKYAPEIAYLTLAIPYILIYPRGDYMAVFFPPVALHSIRAIRHIPGENDPLINKK